MRRYIYYIYSILVASVAFSCTHIQDEDIACDMFECPLVLNGNVPTYTDMHTRAAASWQTDSRLYMRFTSESGTRGYAIYSAATNTWNAYLNSVPRETSEGRMEVHYFEGATYDDLYNAQMTSANGVFFDAEGTYKYSKAGGLEVSINLTPKYGRMRFKGEAGQTITVVGFKYGIGFLNYSSYLQTSKDDLTLTVNQDGYTDYIYGEFSNATTRMLTLTSEGVKYTTYCSSDMYKAGDSGYLSIPTLMSHAGWESDHDASSDTSISVDDFDTDECWDQSITATCDFSMENFVGEDNWSPKGK